MTWKSLGPLRLLLVPPTLAVSVLLTGCGGGKTASTATSAPTATEACTAKVVAALDQLIDSAGDQSAYSQAANDVGLTLGIESTEYKIFLKLNPELIGEAFRNGRTTAAATARTQARTECKAASPVDKSVESNS